MNNFAERLFISLSDRYVARMLNNLRVFVGVSPSFHSFHTARLHDTDRRLVAIETVSDHRYLEPFILSAPSETGGSVHFGSSTPSCALCMGL